MRLEIEKTYICGFSMLWFFLMKETDRLPLWKHFSPRKIVLCNIVILRPACIYTYWLQVLYIQMWMLNTLLCLKACKKQPKGLNKPWGKLLCNKKRLPHCFLKGQKLYHDNNNTLQLVTLLFHKAFLAVLPQ